MRGERLKGASRFSVLVQAVQESPNLSHDDDGNRVLEEFSDVFAEPPAGLPPEREGVDHVIELVDGKSPPFNPIHHLSKPEREAAERFIKELLAKGYIEPSVPQLAHQYSLFPRRMVLCAW